MKRTLAVLLLLSGAASVSAQQLPPPGPPVPSALELAVIPGLSTDQQLSLRKIFVQRRDAIDALMTKQHADIEALRAKERSERERIDDNTDASLRKLLGDDGFRKFAEWQLAERGGPHAGGPAQRMPGPGGKGEGRPSPGGGRGEGPQQAPKLENEGE